MNEQTQLAVVEAFILASPEPIAPRKIAEVTDGLTPSKLHKTVADLNNRYMETGSSFRIREVAGGYQFYILPEFGGFLEDLFARRRKLRLTKAALETLAIAAYRQPVTKAEIEHIRGVASDGVIQNLAEKKMIVLKGRAKTAGRPLQYGTGEEFLKFFGINSLEDLPEMSELEKLVTISSEIDDSVPMLPLTQPESDQPAKLNVADGTFDPSRREAADEDENNDEAQAPETDEEEELEEAPVGELAVTGPTSTD